MLEVRTTSMETRRPSLGNCLILVAIVALGFLLRLYHLDYQSVWSDEAFSITASAKPLGSLTSFLVQRDQHPPLHYYLLHFVFSLFGYGALQARVVSLIFGTLSILALYFLARRLFDATAGLLSALLLAVSQLGVAYSQEARNYSQLLFLSILTAHLFITSLRGRRRSCWWGFLVSAILLIYTHYYGVFILFCLILFAILYRKRHPIPRLWCASGILLVTLCYAPWLFSGVVQNVLARGRNTPHPGQVSSLSVHWYTPVAAINWFNNGKLLGFNAPSPWWTYVLGGLLFSLPMLLALKELSNDAAPLASRQGRDEGLVLICLLWLVPLLLVCATGLIKVLYNPRFTVYIVGFYYVLVARGIAGLRHSALRYGLVLTLSAYSLYSLRAVYFVPYKEDNRAAVAYAASGYSESDCILFWPEGKAGEPSSYWKIYQWRHPGIRVVDFEGIPARRADCKRMWLVMDRTWWKNLETSKLDLGRETLERYYSPRTRREYYGAEVALYERKQEWGTALRPTEKMGGGPDQGPPRLGEPSQNRNFRVN
jgi:mannosyltransferase